MDLSEVDQRLDRILIESSGVAMPGAIASSVSIMEGLHVDGIVVLADAETIQEQANNDYIGDNIERQLLDADLVLLNKCDLVEQDQLEELQFWLETKAQNATVVSVQHATVPNDIVLQEYDRFGLTSSTDFHAHVDVFESRVIPFEKEVDAEAVARTLAHADHRLIRAKGFVPTSAGMRAIHTVGRRWAVSDAPAGATSGVVVIAEKLGSRISSLAAFFENAN